MLVQTSYTLTKREERLAQDALGGLEFLPQDWYRDENPEKGHLPYDSLPEPIRHATEDIRWLLRPSGSQVSIKRLSRVFVSLATLRNIVDRQSDPNWWTSRGAPGYIAETREAQLERIDHLISELGNQTDTDPEDEDDD